RTRAVAGTPSRSRRHEGRQTRPLRTRKAAAPARSCRVGSVAGVFGHHPRGTRSDRRGGHRADLGELNGRTRMIAAILWIAMLSVLSGTTMAEVDTHAVIAVVPIGNVDGDVLSSVCRVLR